MILNNTFTTLVTDRKYKMMMIRRKFLRRLIICLFIFGGSFYLSMLLFGDQKIKRVINLTELDRCPACYGVSVCPELYSDQIALSNKGWSQYFNAKNVYYGYTTKNYRRVVLKKLAHDSELRELDENLCNHWGLRPGCKTSNIMNTTRAINEKVTQLVAYDLTQALTEPRKGLVVCPYAFSLFDFVQPLLTGKYSNYKFDMMYIWTMLMINPEPIILQAIPKSKGWPVPAYGGVCGRVELVAYEGEPLSSLLHVKWHKKLVYAKKILTAALDFTFKNDRFRFYLLDWSLDNIVVNEKDDTVTFVDLEDVVVLDKHISPNKDLPNWYQRYNRQYMGNDFSFSIENMCRHHLSDHNLWAACYVIAGGDQPLLHPVPSNLSKLFHNCIHEEDRFNTVTRLLNLISEMLSDYTVVNGSS